MPPSEYYAKQVCRIYRWGLIISKHMTENKKKAVLQHNPQNQVLTEVSI
jgi:hypothetical protein